ncbi:hypothetical protein HMI56_003286 [Coelomomyces lativittatus]|nr:hypothetical protein HMI56_003286 [Coelomomyces lativittatus]
MDEDMQKFQNSLVEEVIGKGMDLKEYTSNLTERLSKVEEELVRDYIASVPQLADLETKISSCEVFLDKMNSLLVGFQKDLGQVSKEIETLQTSNNQLTVSWKNRFTLQSQLSEVIDQTLVSPELIQSILEAEINETYLKHIENLNARMHYVKNNKNTRMRAFRDVGPELERLRNKSAERIREFLIDKLKPLRQINTNIQMIQTNVLLKQAPLNLFLMQWHREMALEIRQHYILTVSKYYASLMEKYIRGLQKRLIPVFDRQDLLGVEELSKDTTLLLNFMKSNPTTQTPPKMKNVFAIATRAMVLRDFDAPVIIVHIAEEQDLKFPIEVLFRSLTRMLLDLCSMEYAFCADFFVNQRKEMGPPHAIATSVFQLITEATLKMALQSIETWCSLSYDLIGMILATKVHLCHRTLLLQRNLHIDTFSTFMENVQDILVHRYTQLMDLHVVSLKKCKFTSKQIQLHYVCVNESDSNLFFLILRILSL